MSYKLELLPGEPILWETWGADFEPEIDAASSAQEEVKILDAASVQMVIITDTRAINLTFDDILYLASNAVPDELNRHPRLGKMILITTNESVAKSAKGLNNEVFGYIKIDIVTSPDEALNRARQFLS